MSDVLGVGIQLAQFTPTTTVNPTDGLYTDQNGQETRTTIAQILAYVVANGPGVWLVGAPPAPGTGVVGQIAIDIVNGFAYGPLTLAGWPAGVPFGSNDAMAAIDGLIEGTLPDAQTLLDNDTVMIGRGEVVYQATMTEVTNYIANSAAAGSVSPQLASALNIVFS